MFHAYKHILITGKVYEYRQFSINLVKNCTYGPVDFHR